MHAATAFVHASLVQGKIPSYWRMCLNTCMSYVLLIRINDIHINILKNIQFIDNLRY